MMKLAGFLIFLLCAEICSEVHVAAQTAVPLSADLGRYYFASPAAEVAARADLDAALKRLNAFKGQLNTGSNLLKVLQAQEDVLKIYRKHDESPSPLLVESQGSGVRSRRPTRVGSECGHCVPEP